MRQVRAADGRLGETVAELSDPCRVDFRNADREALLLIAGSADHMVPSRINRRNYRGVRGSRSGLATIRGDWIVGP